MIAFVILTLQIPACQDTLTWKQKVEQLNIWGLLALLPGVVCLCLALQWGGFTYNVSVISKCLNSSFVHVSQC